MTAFRSRTRRAFRTLIVLAALAWLSGVTTPASPAPPGPVGYATLGEAIAATVPAGGLTQQAYIKASNAQNGDQLGYSVAIDGDTAVVGAFTEDSNAVGVNGNQADNSMAAAGAAYVFVRSGGFWSQQAYLKASNTATDDNFGVAVDIHGDTIVVGAPREDSASALINGDQANNGSAQAGAAYVFVRSGSTWSQQAYLKPSTIGGVGGGDQFGSVVAVSANTVVVSSPGEDSNSLGVNGNQTNNLAQGSGAAWVFVRSGTSWSQQAYLKASNTDPAVTPPWGDQFGSSLDVDGDTIVVGAGAQFATGGEDSCAVGINGNQLDNSCTDAGAAFVFVRTGTVWAQQAYLKASNTGVDDRFGIDVAVSGDTIVVGAFKEDSGAAGVNGNQSDNSATDAGAAYVFTRSGTMWSQQAYLKAPNAAAGAQFGWAVAISQDTIIIGAPAENSGGDPAVYDLARSGAAYVYQRTGASWSQTNLLKASNLGLSDQFGFDVGVSGDTVLVGANGEDSASTTIDGDGTSNAAESAGAAYVFVPTVNQSPVAGAGVDEVVPATSPTGASVTLAEAGSSDPDGDTLTYTWSEGATVVGTGATLTTTVAIGTHTFTLTVDDGNGGQASDDVVIEVRDVLSVTAATPPITPATYTFGQLVLADYACSSSGGLLATCSGTVAVGAAIDTSTLGTHTFEVTATNSIGDTTTSSWTYEVTKATSTVTVNCPASSAYTGGTQTPCTATANGVGMAPVDVSASLVYLNNSGVGTATVSANWAGDATHVGSAGLGKFNIVTAPVTAVLTANSKVYDGTTTAPNIGLSCALIGVAPVDAGNVVCSPSAGVFDNPNVGSPRSVTATLTLTGSAAGNYTFGAAGTNVASTVTANAPTSTTASAVYGQAGDFTTGVANNGGVSAASLASARGVAADVDGNIYVADRDNNRVLFFPFGQTTATRVYGQAGSFTTNAVNNGGLSADSLRNPTRVSVDSHGGLYVSDPGNFRVLYFPPGSTTATRVYGQLGSFTTAIANNGGISADSLGSPRAVAIDADDNVYIADATNSRVLFYPAGSTTATRVYGQNGNFTTGLVNNTTGVAGVISAESLNTPNGIRLDTNGNLYVVDQQNNRVLMYPAGQTTATVVYGQGGSFVTNLANNGGISADSLSTPSNLAIDGGNNVYVGDQGNARVLFFPSGQTTATVVYGQFGSFATGTPNNGGASADSLANPNSVDLDFAGNIYVSDFGNNRVLRFTGAAPAITPATLSISAANISKVYGTAATITPTFDGFVNGETSAVLTSAPVCTSAGAAAEAPVGTYTITCSGAAADNYTIVYTAGTLSVDPKPALVTPNAASKVYGSDDPALTGSISGFLPGDGVTAVFTRAVGETVAGGPYPITATLSPAYVLSNYAIVYQAADFTILKANQTISLGASPSDGVPDAAFRVSVGAGFNDRVTSAVVQPDGKIVVGGLFTTFDGVAANRIIRLHPDGTRDTSFSTGGSGFDHQVNSVALQSDGKIIVGGQFQNLNGAPARRIARLNQDGTPDATFTTNTGAGFDQAVLVVLVQPDDKILASGYFFRLNGVLSKEIARINADGTPDVAFRTNLAVGFAGCCIYGMALQPDGKIVVIGDFHTFNQQPAANVARINADGTPDVAFISNTGAGFNAGGTGVAVLSDGKILLGGSFTTLNNVAAKGIARLNGDGTPDTAYSPAVVPFFNAGVFAVQSDGKIVAGSAGYSKRLARLNADGTLDTVFDTNLGTGVNAAPEQVVLQPDGAILLVGPFTSLNGATANRIARLLPGSGAITKTYGDAAFTVSASASSGLPVSFSSSTPAVCTVAGNTITIVGAGTCTVAADQAGDSNYHAAPTVNQDVTVNKAASTTTVTCPVSVPFDGSAQTPCTATTTGAGGFSESASVTYTANTNAGTATANATYPGGANHNASTGAANFTIARATLTVSLVANGKVYDGTTAITNANMSCTIAGVAVGDLEHVACVATSGTFDSADAGARTVTATATITGTAAGNYTFDAVGTAVTSISASTPATISKAASTTTVSCPVSVTYTGAALEVCTATATGVGGLSDSVAVTYSNNTNAGTASASASFAGDANHDASAGSATFAIGKAASSTTVSCPTSVTYTGAAQEVCSATVTGAGGLSEAATVTYSNNTNAGTASASASFAGDANHDASTGSATFAIGKAASTTTVSCPTSVTYTGAAQDVCTATVTGVGGLSESVAVTYSNNTNAGPASASASFAGGDNHDASTGSATFEIGKASSSTTVSCPVSVTYTGAAQEVCTATVAGVGGLSESVAVTYTNNTNAGTASASASFAGDANHDASTGSATFEIGKAASSTTVTCPTSVTYTGAAQEVCTATVAGVGGLSEAATVTYSNNTNAGTASASASFAGDANHDASTGSATFEIGKAASTTTVSCPTSVTFTGTAQEVCTATVTGVGGLSESVAVTYSNNTNAGTASASASFAGDANHDASTGSATFAIGKAASTTTVTCPTSVPYTGAAQEVCTATVAGVGGLSEAVTVSYSNNTNAGTASASASFAGDANHDASTGSATFEIGKAASTTTVSCPVSVTYTGAAQEVCTATVAGVGGLSEAVTVSYSNNTNAGTASASASFTGDDNHDASTGSATFAVGKAASTTTVSCPTTVTYTGAAQEVCTAAVTGVGSLSEAVTVSYSNNTNAGTASASASFAGDNNHDASTGSATFVVGKAASTTTVSCPVSVTYTGAAQEVCTATVAGVGGLSEAVTVSYSNNTNAGTAGASASFAGDDNHDASTGSAAFEIGKAESTTTVSCPTSVIFTGLPMTPCSVTVTGVSGFSASPTASYSNNVVLGTATASYTFDGNDNHNGSSASATFIITALPPVLTVPTATTIEATGSSGATHEYTVEALDPQGLSTLVSCTPESGSTFAIGETVVSCTATNAAGLASGAQFTVTVVDTTAPVITTSDITVVATAAAGVEVTYSPTAADLVDGDVTPVCSPTSGSVFTIGTHTVSCSATDAAGNGATTTFAVQVVDGVLPVIVVPANMAVEATSATGASVTFDVTASDNVDEQLTATCLPASGATFPIGETTVHCSTVDAAGNTGVANFTVTVADTVAPALTLPSLVTETLDTGTTRVVEYMATAVDVVDGPIVPVCTPASGSAFPVGDTTVNCTATDAAGNVATGTFVVHVNDGRPPVVTISPAGNQVVEATSALGAPTTFTASAVDAEGVPVPVTCSTPSGATFPLGTTTVTCSATNSYGNVGSVTFDIAVVDTTAPVLSLPEPITATADSSAGVAVSFVATGVDVVDGTVAVSCLPASGTVFPVGVTTVSCATSDTRGNASTGTFSVTVAVEDNQVGRFVVLSRDGTWLREKTKVISGDVGANERRFHPNDRGDDDGDRNDVTVRLGEGVTMEQVGSRVVGSTVLMFSKSSVYDVVTNALLNKRGTVRGTVDSPMTIPFTDLPAFPTVSAGWNAVEVARNKTSTLAAGRYGDVVVKSGATLVLTGGLYQMRSLELEQNATVLFRGPSEIRVQREVHTGSKSKMILDRNVPGLRASQMVIYVEGDDSCGRRGDRDDDGDDAGQVTVHIGQQSTVQASIYAQAGTIWLKSKTQATGAFIGVHVRVGQKVTLTLDSAFR